MGSKPYAVFAVLAVIICLTPKAHAQRKSLSAAPKLASLAVPSSTLIQAQKAPARVDITFNGKVAIQPVTIMAGQPVTLAWIVTGGPPVARYRWDITASAVGGWEASPQAGKVIPAPPFFHQETMKLYWIDPGVKPVWLEYELSDRSLGKTSITFNVQGPTKIIVTACGTQPPACPLQKISKPVETGIVKVFDNGQQVGVGDGNATNVGILFTASATMPSGGSGKFIWVQKIISDEFHYAGPGLSLTDMSTGGLDLCTPQRCGTTEATWQFDTGPVTADSPSQPTYELKDEKDPNSKLFFGKEITDLSREFTASMFLMWQSDVANSIPVPLGSIVWYCGWDLMSVPKSNPPWVLKGFAKPAYYFQPSIVYPEWNGVSTIKRVP